VASSPTREDKSPSLNIMEHADGRIILHDFGGDSVESILGALGLSFADLFPAASAGHSAQRVRRPFNASDVLSFVAFEATVVLIVVSNVVRGNAIEKADFDRLLLAAQRLGHAAEVCNGPR
jgi:hypothetical protein